MTTSNQKRPLQLIHDAELNTPQDGRHYMEYQSETRTDEELATITGYKMPAHQRQWLLNNGWVFVLTGAQRPIVGRVYTRLKLAGVRPSESSAVAETWSLDLSRVV